MTFQMFDRISADPNICLGQPTVTGTRITVSVILRMLASGMSCQEIAQEYPELSKEDAQQAAAYGAWLASEQSRAYPS
ncbi:MAG: DUF433 domain-containing protein [Nitrospinae bacterium]|nr:DUF433 domain-containing protein [Nitrospinota bacterium]